MRRLATLILGRGEFDRLQGRLAVSAGGTLVLKVSFAGLSFATAVLLARVLGASGFGAYAYAMAWVGLLSIVSALGLDRLLLRNTATYLARSSWGLMRGLARRSNQTALGVSLALAGVVAAISWLPWEDTDPEMLATLRLALILLPLITLTRLRQVMLQGLHRVVLGQLPELLVLPLLFLLMLGAAYLLMADRLTATAAMGLYIAATAVAFAVGTFILRRTLPPEAKAATPRYSDGIWLKIALPLFLVAGMSVVGDRAAIIMLGAIKGTESVGVFSVVSRGAELITFFLMAVNPALAPTIAGLHAKGDRQRLQRVVVRSARVTLALSLPVALGLAVFGRWFLAIFGPEFVEGRLALAVLSLGQLANVTTGIAGLLLMMTEHERDAAWGFGLSAALSLVLNAALIPAWGLVGAATATAATLLFRGVLLAWAVHRRLGIQAHPFATGDLRGEASGALGAGERP